jgi:sporulation protein YlmC with PRC-barrel domain
MPNENLDQVVPLKQLDDFKVAEGEPDVRGWEVVSADGRKIGEVDELLVDTSAMKVRYLDVDLNDELIAGDPDRHVLVPIGYARLERERDCVVVDNLNASDLQALPAYGHSPLTRDFETSVRESFHRPTGATGTTAATGGTTAATGMTSGTTTGARGTADDFYAHESFDESRFWAGRRGTEPGAGGLGNTDPDLRRGLDESGGPGNQDPNLRNL